MDDVYDGDPAGGGVRRPTATYNGAERSRRAKLFGDVLGEPRGKDIPNEVLPTAPNVAPAAEELTSFTDMDESPADAHRPVDPRAAALSSMAKARELEEAMDAIWADKTTEEPYRRLSLRHASQAEFEATDILFEDEQRRKNSEAHGIASKILNIRAEMATSLRTGIYEEEQRRKRVLEDEERARKEREVEARRRKEQEMDRRMRSKITPREKAVAVGGTGDIGVGYITTRVDFRPVPSGNEVEGAWGTPVTVGETNAGTPSSFARSRGSRRPSMGSAASSSQAALPHVGHRPLQPALPRMPVNGVKMASLARVPAEVEELWQRASRGGSASTQQQPVQQQPWTRAVDSAKAARKLVKKDYVGFGNSAEIATADGLAAVVAPRAEVTPETDHQDGITEPLVREQSAVPATVPVTDDDRLEQRLRRPRIEVDVAPMNHVPRLMDPRHKRDKVHLSFNDGASFGVARQKAPRKLDRLAGTLAGPPLRPNPIITLPPRKVIGGLEAVMGLQRMDGEVFVEAVERASGTRR
ncbi:hypothetical protein HK101_003023 [Irineochytrium annulatum]|nr:hypothetical protein HK101_003023 [Irineochytrium annulatum]